MPMFDAQCNRCKRRFGWSGSVADRPPCPKCGHQLTKEQLETDEKKIEELKTLLRSKATTELCRKQRSLAGLTLAQAAVKLGLTTEQLREYEQGKELPKELARAMEQLYQVGDY